MHYEGSVEIKAPAEELWGFLTTPDRVSQCFPGLQSVQVVEPGKKFRFVVTAKLGSIQPTFELDVSYTSVTPPTSARLSIQGKGPDTHIGATSFMFLKSRGESLTEMEWSFDLAASGMVATLGSRLIGQVADGMTAQFIRCVRETVEGSAPEPVVAYPPLATAGKDEASAVSSTARS